MYFRLIGAHSKPVKATKHGFLEVPIKQPAEMVRLIEFAETIFGWTVQGADLDNGSHGASEPSCAMFITHADPSGSNPEEEMDPSDLWRLEAIGIKETAEGPGLDAEATKKFEREIRKQDGRYEVPLLIQEPELEAHHDNYALAEQRLRMQLRRFRNRPDLLSQYDKTIRDYFKEGYAERVPAQGTRGTTNTYYMPHHGVVRQDAVTTKLRVVFDASSHAPGHPSPLAAASTGEPNHYSAVIRHGNTVVPSGESRIAAEADKVANIPAACEPCVSDHRNVLTAVDESDPPVRPAESTTDSTEAHVGVPSRPPCGDCVVVQDGHGTDLSKDPTTTMYGDANPASVMLLHASDIAAARGSALLREHVVVKCRERAPFPLVRRWPYRSGRWLLRWNLSRRQRFLVSPTLIGAPAFRVGSHEPSGDPCCGELLNGNRAASTAALGGPLPGKLLEATPSAATITVPDARLRSS
ncbi:hypothetical protein HPB48_000243 [Haemaphysalis longicornis]|uniref:Uncharacterized protein n=1 Tax=Haemaphysalis longicornis TaxID=44386 RepID=A0A9J6FY04_HAELO|nr:hypothetical protein HPB48_000243 [Haemaphysalis longicornis]